MSYNLAAAKGHSRERHSYAATPEPARPHQPGLLFCKPIEADEAPSYFHRVCFKKMLQVLTYTNARSRE
jgi:hypothetical protein